MANVICDELYRKALICSEDELLTVFNELREECKKENIRVENYYIPLLLQGIRPESDIEINSFLLDVIDARCVYGDGSEELSEYLEETYHDDDMLQHFKDSPSTFPIFRECFEDNGCDYDLFLDEAGQDIINSLRLLTFENYAYDDDEQINNCIKANQPSLAVWICAVRYLEEKHNEDYLKKIKQYAEEGIVRAKGVLNVLEKENCEKMCECIFENIINENYETPDYDYWIYLYNAVKENISHIKLSNASSPNAQIDNEEIMPVKKRSGCILFLFIPLVIASIWCWYVSSI